MTQVFNIRQGVVTNNRELKDSSQIVNGKKWSITTTTINLYEKIKSLGIKFFTWLTSLIPSQNSISLAASKEVKINKSERVLNEVSSTKNEVIATLINLKFAYMDSRMYSFSRNTKEDIEKQGGICLTENLNKILHYGPIFFYKGVVVHYHENKWILHLTTCIFPQEQVLSTRFSESDLDLVMPLVITELEKRSIKPEVVTCDMDDEITIENFKKWQIKNKA